MANTSTRSLQLLSLLQTHRYWPGDELAARLAVSPRTLRRDVDRLRELGYPVTGSRGVAGGYQLRPGAVLPPLLVDDDEAVAIVIGLRSAAGGVVAGIEDTAVRALAKIVQVLPPRLRQRVDALQAHTVPALAGGDPVDAVALTTIALAARDAERVRFSYGDASRLVEPHTLVTLGRRWYLVAWDLDRHDWRTFRLDRLTDPVPTGARFRLRDLPGGDPAAFVRARVGGVPTRYRVEVVVRAAADVVTAAVGRWGTVEALDEQSCRLRMDVHQLDDPIKVVAGLGADFEILEPAELRDRVQAIGETFLRSTERRVDPDTPPRHAGFPPRGEI
ncbi:putative DNA-binding transcriptional regulator YafY [Asanoa ferruginea]|uniref:Putative DNA-binding transcriptional regulator YafY n=1 Tax=Asanoa ferruginea TaxID=53367 RepID=A0A3D9ZJC6_9ACTN|nr:YafY family protein [Asanoa ferruginea]REF97536.1 putative DNA-binding transcriptional regulator YafY [Asanoa ferruginea]GIF48637.1 DNA-binding transcriptional regulator [Asanoa ferruginea]